METYTTTIESIENTENETVNNNNTENYTDFLITIPYPPLNDNNGNSEMLKVKFDISIFFKVVLYDNFDYDNGKYDLLINDVIFATINNCLMRIPATNDSKSSTSEDYNISKMLMSPSNEREFNQLLLFKEFILDIYMYKNKNRNTPFKNAIEYIDKNNNIHILNMKIDSIKIIN